MLRTTGLLIALALALTSAPALAGDVMVHLQHGRLQPAVVIVTMGDTVTFHNLDAMPGGHTVAADDGSFESPPLAKDEQWAHTFETPGMYPFHLKEHPDTKGKVVVE